MTYKVLVALCAIAAVTLVSARPSGRSNPQPTPRTPIALAPTPEADVEPGAGNAIVHDCFDVDEHHCLTANPTLHPAISLLLSTAKGPGLIQAATRAGISVRLGAVPRKSMAVFRPSSHTVTVDARLGPLSTRGQAAVLAHELRHVANWAGIGRALPQNMLNCYNDEASAFTTEVATWKQVKQEGPPADSLEAEEDDVAYAMDTRGLGFWLQLGRIYHEECA